MKDKKTSSSEMAGRLLAKFLAEKKLPISTEMHIPSAQSLTQASYYRISMKIANGPPRKNVVVIITDDGAVALDLMFDGFPQSSRPQLAINIHDPGSFETILERIQAIQASSNGQ